MSSIKKFSIFAVFFFWITSSLGKIQDDGNLGRRHWSPAAPQPILYIPHRVEHITGLFLKVKSEILQQSKKTQREFPLVPRWRCDFACTSEGLGQNRPLWSKSRGFKVASKKQAYKQSRRKLYTPELGVEFLGSCSIMENVETCYLTKCFIELD